MVGALDGVTHHRTKGSLGRVEMNGEDATLLRELKDRQEIYDCLMRYCCGVDRLDRDMLLSAYHPDALDDHGHVVGPVDRFADNILAMHSERQHRTQHHITNHRCTIEGDVAHAESYFIYRAVNRNPPVHTLASGRYFDRFERREGRWAIAARICVTDIMDDGHAPTGLEHTKKYLPSSRDRNDTSYNIPVVVDPDRINV
jgi:hypothetical protein